LYGDLDSGELEQKRAAGNVRVSRGGGVRGSELDVTGESIAAGFGPIRGPKGKIRGGSQKKATYLRVGTKKNCEKKEKKGGKEKGDPEKFVFLHKLKNKVTGGGGIKPVGKGILRRGVEKAGAVAKRKSGGQKGRASWVTGRGGPKLIRKHRKRQRQHPPRPGEQLSGPVQGGGGIPHAEKECH